MLGAHTGGTVYLAESITLKSKRIIKETGRGSPLYSQLVSEAEVIKNLCHPGIPILYDVEEDDKSMRIIEQYMEGESLGSFCRKNCLSEEQIIDTAIQICDIIAYLHSQDPPVLYLDLKPDNIIIHEGKAALIDFGSAVYQCGGRQPVSGTAGFAAPEQRKGRGIGPRTDIYGIGRLIMFMAAAGDVGYMEAAADICSPRLAAVIRQCTREAASARCRNVYVLREKLRRLTKSGPRIGKIAVAGVNSNVGTTHISIMLTAYINRYFGGCTYIECNDGQAVNRIAADREIIPERGSFRVGGIRFVSQKGGEAMRDGERPAPEVRDYGVLCSGNLQNFLDADLSLLIMCCRPWELPEARAFLELCGGMDNVKIVLNLTSGERPKKFAGGWTANTCCSIGFAPDPFHVTRDKSVLRALAALLG